MIKGKCYMTVQGDEISVGVGVASDELSFVVKIPQQQNTSDKQLEGIAKHYDLGGVLGQGAFAIVRKAIERESGQTYAVKVIKKNHMTKNVAVNKEVEILKQLNHENVAGLHDFYEDDRNYYLVMDYLAGGDLMEFVLQNGPIPEDASREVVRQILKAVQYVHGLGISHRDLKPDNILIAQDNPVLVKVSDFGLAKMQQSGSFLKTFCGTLAYLAPEVLFSRDRKLDAAYSNICDIWSIGCLAYVILTGYLPFDGNTQEQMNNSVGTGRFQLRPLLDKNLSKSGIDFISSLLTVDPQQRPNATVCLNLPWMLEGEQIETSESSFGSFSNEIKAEEGPVTPQRKAPPPPRPLPPLPEKEVTPDPVELQSSYNEIPISSLQIHSSVGEINQIKEQQDKQDDDYNHNDNHISLPALDEYDSDSDSQEIKDQAEIQLSQRSGQHYAGSSMQIESSFDSGIQVRNGACSSPAHQVIPYQQPGVRDFDSIGLAHHPPPGAYMRLDTLPNSKPFRDIYVTHPNFTLGRVVDNDVQVDDPRVSKRHCEIVRIAHSGSGVKHEIWLVDRSSNGCFLNGELIGAGKKALLESGDTICLFIDMDRERNSKFHFASGGWAPPRPVAPLRGDY